MSLGVGCRGCFSGALGAAPPACPGASGLRDGRGYGPYGTGYYDGPGGLLLPYGPQCQRLPAEADFRPGPDGSYLHHLPPAFDLMGAAAPGDSGVLAVLLGVAAVGLGAVLWSSARNVRPVRRRRR